MFKRILFTGLMAMSMSSVTHAFSLELQNNTNLPSTSKINGTCSSMIPGGSGITKPHSHNSISGFLVKSVCGFTAKTCKAEVYATENCDASGAAKIADMVLDLVHGGITPSNIQPGYTFTSPGAFAVTLDGGPALA
jgi:hypothetical protein